MQESGHQALYRKWRPATFREVVGQEHVTDVLRYQVKSGRVSHAYLFCGSRGTGKTTCAKILAKAVNCLSPKDGDPCGQCEACRMIADGTATDVLEMDAASNTGVDYIRDIRDEVVFSPSALKMRVYIIDEVHMLTDSAANALLKTLEEPPEGVLFILATTEMHKIPATVLSRCQSFDFRRLSTDVISQRLLYIAEQEGFSVDSDAAFLIARLSEGGMRDAINLLELCSAGGERITVSRVEAVSGSAGKKTVAATVRAIIEKNGAELLSIVAELYRSAKDIAVFWQELLSFYRDMMVLKTASSADEKKMQKLRVELLDATEAEMKVLQELSAGLRYETLLYHVQILDDAYGDILRGGDKRLCAEMTLLRLTNDRLDTTPEAMLHRIRALEDALLLRGAPLPPVSAVGKEEPAAPSAPECEAPAAGGQIDSASGPEPCGDESSADPADASDREAPQREIEAYREIVSTFQRVNHSSAAFLGDSGYIDGKKIAHLRVKTKFQITMLDKPEIKETLCRLISSCETPVSGVVFELSQEKKDGKKEITSSIFDEEAF